MSVQRNVQQQNATTRAEICRVANLFKSTPADFAWLSTLLRSNGLNEDKGILAQLSTTIEQEGNLKSGVWLTLDCNFWEFSVMLARDTGEIIEVELFQKVTDSLPISDHVLGKGRSFASIACTVMTDMFHTK